MTEIERLREALEGLCAGIAAAETRGKISLIGPLEKALAALAATPPGAEGWKLVPVRWTSGLNRSSRRPLERTDGMTEIHMPTYEIWGLDVTSSGDISDAGGEFRESCQSYSEALRAREGWQAGGRAAWIKEV